MKKLLVISFVLASAHSSGQSFVQGIVSRLSVGVKAGANYSDYVHADFKTDPLIGFHAGGIVNFRCTQQLSVQEEFLFSSQGAKIADVDRKVYYLTVPILLKYRTNLGLYFEAGGQTGMRLHEDVEGLAKQLDFGAAAGLGYQSKMGLGFGVRYVAGVSKAGMSGDFRSGVAQGSVFYIF
ncbi:porin family protein [Chitinophaga sancti]|uniref:Outer membrane protein beta-barrel domain-containing protein n=1 Tax=Chitinophaga sancti TaxID=1004 RepID=A0A1K1S4X3_9BACT|nr:porin family protein [Chitinophaga sancti]WQD63742.1 porin family protein [Chitinophaga sancti]WQG90633.1 porin family protein [Chitinophaga sancti]SFW79124.1 Outer membrane protein beta-barrel domain-containing protein [Chitinophaga sancti]